LRRSVATASCALHHLRQVPFPTLTLAHHVSVFLIRPQPALIHSRYSPPRPTALSTVDLTSTTSLFWPVQASFPPVSGLQDCIASLHQTRFLELPLKSTQGNLYISRFLLFLQSITITLPQIPFQ
ncbi:hypothetical protein J1614_007587, partial [Plenodomus biglobosus]